MRAAGESCANSRYMKTTRNYSISGKIGWILLWVLGIPIPVLLIFFLLRGCT